MKNKGKIASLPNELREQVNLRLNDEEEQSRILEWLNAMPQVQELLAAEFDGRPISRQNLSEWKHNGFTHWQLSQTAAQFAQTLEMDKATLPEILHSTLTARLAHWIALRYAAIAHSISKPDDDPEKELDRLRALCGDIVALRRGELGAARLALEHQRLEADLAERKEAMEKIFMAWAQRPEVIAKFFPNIDPEEIRREVLRYVEREFLVNPRPARHSTKTPQH